jgi:two-component system sensor histidine kinase AlgZ
MRGNQPEPNTTELIEGCYLPDFCSLGTVFRVVLGAELLAFMLVLGPGELTGDAWTDLGLLSLMVQWIALGSTSLLCLARRPMARQSVTAVTIYAFVIALSVTLAVVVGAALLARSNGFNQIFTAGWEQRTLLHAMGISTIVSVVTLRYFYVLHQWRLQVIAESRARLQALQARIRPHFLFNSMNTIASLTRSDPGLAENVVLDLADLFRATLQEEGISTSLAKEFEIARRYLSIEQLRLGERLMVNWSLKGVPDDAQVPTLLLQPLLENAVYHGIEQLRQGGDITIHGWLQQARILLRIENPTPATRQDSQRKGLRMALENTRQRLRAAFGEEARMQANQKGDQYVVVLEFPYRSEQT